jgi:hypothetical protein
VGGSRSSQRRCLEGRDQRFLDTCESGKVGLARFRATEPESDLASLAPRGRVRSTTVVPGLACHTYLTACDASNHDGGLHVIVRFICTTLLQLHVPDCPWKDIAVDFVVELPPSGPTKQSTETSWLSSTGPANCATTSPAAQSTPYLQRSCSTGISLNTTGFQSLSHQTAIRSLPRCSGKTLRTIRDTTKPVVCVSPRVRRTIRELESDHGTIP